MKGLKMNNNTETSISENLGTLNSTVGEIWQDVIDLKNKITSVADSEVFDTVLAEAKDVGDYVKDNWKKVLAVSLAVGVSAYLLKNKNLLPLGLSDQDADRRSKPARKH